MALPDFLVIGAPKAGTTALHAALSRHPQLYLPEFKEPKFFCCDGPPPRRGGPGDAATYQRYVWRRGDYEALFDPAPRGTLRGEATPFYLADLAAHERIHRLIPRAKLVAVLRDPIDRAHSNWTHMYSAGLEPRADFVTACEREPQRKAAGWEMFWRYLSLGRYGTQLAHLYTLMPRERVLVLRYEELAGAPRAALGRICRFLGVDADAVTDLPQLNVATTADPSPTTRLRQVVLRQGTTAGRVLPTALRRYVETQLAMFRRIDRRRSGPTAGERRRLEPHFADDLALLERVSGQTFSGWLGTAPAPAPAAS